MKIHLALLFILGQLIIQTYWCLFIKKQSQVLWTRLALKKSFFILTLLAEAALSILILNGESQGQTEHFYPAFLAGELAIKSGFLLSVSAGISFFLFSDKENVKTVFRASRVTDISTSMLALGFSCYLVSHFIPALLLCAMALFLFVLAVKDNSTLTRE